jgi:hypothetical protein
MKKKTIIFLCLLIISSLLVGGLGTFLKSSLLEPLGIHRQEHPVALPFVLMEDEMLQAEIQMGLEELQNPPTEPPVTEPLATEPPVTIPEEDITEPVTEPQTTEPQTVETQPKKEDGRSNLPVIFLGAAALLVAKIPRVAETIS